jgi:hypothetical protein
MAGTENTPTAPESPPRASVLKSTEPLTTGEALGTAYAHVIADTAKLGVKSYVKQFPAEAAETQKECVTNLQALDATATNGAEPQKGVAQSLLSSTGPGLCGTPRGAPKFGP